jgi:hypothetical protein
MRYTINATNVKEVSRVLSDAGYSAIARTRKGGPLGVALLRENTFLPYGTTLIIEPGSLEIESSEQAAEAKAGSEVRSERRPTKQEG